MGSLGLFYLAGDGVERDVSRGVSLLEQAIEAGRPKSYVLAGLTPPTGRWSREGCIRWCFLAGACTEAGNPGAMCCLGLHYLEGEME